MFTQVSDWNGDAYREISQLPHGLPSWMHAILEIGTEAGLLVFALMFVVNWWVARRMDSRSMALAVLGPVATVAAYVISEAAKQVFQRPRPCAVLSDVEIIATCPTARDWSFPSNHATIVAASAIAILLARPRWGYVAIPVAALLGISRVLIGVHYPLDVIAGFVLGAVVATVVMALFYRLAVGIVEMMRGYRLVWPLVADRPAYHTAATVRHRPDRRSLLR